jgi:cell division protein FtsI (penicillin-binding protein 3)
VIQTGYFSKKRCRILYFLPLGFFVLICRLFYIQIVSHEHYDQLAVRQHTATQQIVSERGNIVDCNNKTLASSYRSKSLVAYPNLFVNDNDVDTFLRSAAIVIKMPYQKLKNKINPKKKFIWLKRHLTPNQAQVLAKKVKKTKGIGFEEEWSRFYPASQLTSNLLGVVNLEHKGSMGLELYFDKWLKGTPGVREYIHAIRGRPIYSDILKNPVRGHNLKLTVDLNIQTILFSELNESFKKFTPKSCSGIVLNAMTGEILALASLPAHIPGNKVTKNLDGLSPMAVNTVFEPGSTMKPIIYASALEHRLISPSDKIHCGNGAERIGGRILHDTHGYALLSAVDVIVKSSNIGAAKMGRKLGNRRMHRTLSAMGFGVKANLPFYGEPKGMIRPLSKWNKFSTASIPMGHEISATMVQVVRAYASFANGGYVLQPFIEKEIYDEHNEIKKSNTSLSLRKVFSRKTCKKVTEALEQVVLRGTAKRAQSDIYRIAGKTGTTEKIIDGKYVKNKNIGSFVCIAPASKPKIVVMIMVDEPVGTSYGGVVAAPYVKNVVEGTLKYYGTPADKDPKGAI